MLVHQGFTKECNLSQLWKYTHTHTHTHTHIARPCYLSIGAQRHLMSGLQKMRSFLSAILNDYFWLKTSFFQYLLIVCSRPPDECLACFGCRSWDVFGPDWNISNSFTWIMVPEDDVFGFSEMSWQLLNILSLNTVQTFEARGFVILTLTFCVPHWSHIPSLPTLCHGGVETLISQILSRKKLTFPWHLLCFGCHWKL